MANWIKKRVTITFPDNTETVHDYVGGCDRGINVTDGVLHLTVQDGESAPLVHVASYPLTAIRSYRVENPAAGL